MKKSESTGQESGVKLKKQPPAIVRVLRDFVLYLGFVAVTGIIAYRYLL